MVQLRWVVTAAVLAIAASRGTAAQDLPPSQRPSFAGTWAPADPEWSDLLFKNDFGSLYLDSFPDLKLVDYGFFWRRTTVMDDITWWLFRKA